MIPARDNIKTVAAVHELGGELRLVVATIGGSGGSSDGPVVSQTTTLPVSAGWPAVGEWLEKVGADLLIRVLPSGRTIARTTGIPEGQDTQSIANALSLAAEGELPSNLPAYRRCAGTIGPGPRGSRPTALLTGWPVRTDGTELSWRQTWPGPQVGIAEVAALSSLGALLGGVRCAAVVDDHLGAVGVVAAGTERTSARVARLSTDDASAFPEAAADCVRDTLGMAGVSLEIEGLDGGVHLWPEPSGPRVGGGLRDRAWISSFGVAYGAIATWADPTPSVHGLVGLHDIEPVTKPSIAVRVTRWMGHPGRAAAVLALCVLTLFALPLGVAWARVKSLEKKVVDEPALMTRTSQAERELSFYKLLAEKRWPMTKLLADIAGATPVGITLDTVELGQSEGLTLRGKAEGSEQVTTLRENLNKLKIFEQVTTPSTSPTEGGVQFQLTARIPAGRAMTQTAPIDDFAARTLIDRLYGSQSSSATSKKPSRSGNASSRDRSRPSSASSSASTRSSPPSTSRSERSGNSTQASGDKKALDIPPALTDAQIAKFNATQAMLEWSKRRKASSQPGLDDATKKRLTEEAEKAQRRMREAREQSGGGGT